MKRCTSKSLRDVKEIGRHDGSQGKRRKRSIAYQGSNASKSDLKRCYNSGYDAGKKSKKGCSVCGR